MTLVSVIGDYDSSILPIFYEFKDEIQKHILVYDDFKNDVTKAKRIEKGIKKFRKEYGYNFDTETYVVDEDSMEAINRLSEYLLQSVSQPDELYINTTDGLSSLNAILNYNLFKNNVNFLSYDRYDNEYNLFSKERLQKKKLQNNLNIYNHFLLKGYGIETTEAGKVAKKYVKEVKSLFQQHLKEYDAFLKLPPAATKIDKLSSEFKNIKTIFKKMGYGNLNIKDSKVTGSLFEMYLYLLLLDLDVDDISLGLIVTRKYKNSKIMNEFDILVMKENHLHMIECKYRNSLNLEELVYKYIALSNILDEDAKMLIATKKPHDYTPYVDAHETQGRVYKRGKLNNIAIVGDIIKNPAKFVLEVRAMIQTKG